MYALADAVLAVSHKERDLVNDLTNDVKRAHVVPLLEELPKAATRRRDRRGIAFIGNFWHAPNRAALSFLLEEIVPRMDPQLLKRHPLRVIGHKLDEALADIGSIPDGVDLVGWVPSIGPYLERARVNVIPLLSGAGTKCKLVQGLMIGTPTVSTRIGIEGILVTDGKDVLVSDEPVDFAASVERLLVDDVLWDRLRRQGRKVGIANHGYEAVRRSLSDALEAVFLAPASAPVVPAGVAN